METYPGNLVDRTVRTVYTRESKLVKETLLTRLTVLYVLYTHEKKVNLSRETCQGKRALLLGAYTIILRGFKRVVYIVLFRVWQTQRGN